PRRAWTAAAASETGGRSATREAKEIPSPPPHALANFTARDLGTRTPLPRHSGTARVRLVRLLPRSIPWAMGYPACRLRASTSTTLPLSGHRSTTRRLLHRHRPHLPYTSPRAARDTHASEPLPGTAAQAHARRPGRNFQPIALRSQGW